MPRYCFVSRVRPDQVDEYRRRHAAVWPELLRALRDTGWRDYSIFVGDDGLLVGYVEADDLDASQAAIQATDVNRRWQEQMAPLFSHGAKPDENWRHLDEVFNLDDQLATVSRDASRDEDR
ncbi:L-rhamnose mutarotase [Jiangella endophytica]|uniref:L-rhamnose mutarotase n=1 Tax=Jiangella endophytica TaxID=1623398 RepID=UPI000E344530|nr:L-rhamnose mutarotase [Jiangella endophytica]